ncbi:MAG: hypothetical protein HYX41_01870 [Bdellovibrio sp.]|nr:hypothetical protein [Bdellovibrio sp.]
MKLNVLLFLFQFLSSFALAGPGLEDLPFDPLALIASHLDSHTDFRSLGLVSKAIYRSLTDGDESTRQKKARVRKQIADILNPRVSTLSGAVFTRRTDLEWRYREHVTGEIWQEPSQNGFPGLIWFPTEKENQNFLVQTFEGAQEYCLERSRVLGIPLRVALDEEWTHLAELMKNPVSQQYKPQILKNLEGIFWTGSSVNSTFGVVFDGRRKKGKCAHYHVVRPFRVRCALQPALLIAAPQTEEAVDGAEPQFKRRRQGEDAFDPLLPPTQPLEDN